MIHFKGKGEHSINELEQIILEQNEIIHNFKIKAINAMKIEISYPECTLTNSRGDTFTFKNNSKNEGLVDFLSLHEEGLVSFYAYT